MPVQKLLAKTCFALFLCFSFMVVERGYSEERHVQQGPQSSQKKQPNPNLPVIDDQVMQDAEKYILEMQQKMMQENQKLMQPKIQQAMQAKMQKTVKPSSLAASQKEKQQGRGKK